VAIRQDNRGHCPAASPKKKAATPMRAVGATVAAISPLLKKRGAF